MLLCHDGKLSAIDRLLCGASYDNVLRLCADNHHNLLRSGANNNLLRADNLVLRADNHRDILRSGADDSLLRADNRLLCRARHIHKQLSRSVYLSDCVLRVLSTHVVAISYSDLFASPARKRMSLTDGACVEVDTREELRSTRVGRVQVFEEAKHSIEDPELF